MGCPYALYSGPVPADPLYTGKPRNLRYDQRATVDIELVNSVHWATLCVFAPTIDFIRVVFVMRPLGLSRLMGGENNKVI